MPPKATPGRSSVKPRRIREPFLTIVDRVNDRDRAYFHANPSETRYLRPYIPGEHDPKTLHELGIDPPGLDDWVLVHRVAPGIRCRRPIGRIVSNCPGSGRIDLIFSDGGVVKGVPVVDWDGER